MKPYKSKLAIYFPISMLILLSTGDIFAQTTPGIQNGGALSSTLRNSLQVNSTSPFPHTVQYKVGGCNCDNSSLKSLTNVPNKLIMGGSDKGGGDARAIRSLILQDKLDSLVKKSILFFDNKSNVKIDGALSWIVSHKNQLQFENPKHQKILETMIQNGFAQDIQSISFTRSAKCIDKNGVEKTAVASMNKPRSPICINVERFADEFGPYVQDSDVLGLVMHELSHHYGFEDADHSFAAAIAKEWQLDNERRNEEGEPLNYFIK